MFYFFRIFLLTLVVIFFQRAQAQVGIGVGNSNPLEMLDVDGAIKIRNTSTNNAGTIRWTGTAFQGYDGSQWIDFGSNSADADWTISGNNMYAGVTGNIGVGVTNPTSLLDLRSSAGNAVLSLRPNGAGLPRIWLRNSSNTLQWNIGSTGGGSLTFIDAPSSTTPFTIESGAGQNTLVIDGNSRVGIGIANPLDELHIEGSVRMVDGNEAGGYIAVSDANGTMTWTDPATISTADDEDWTITGDDQYSAVSGNVGIGTTTPTQKLDVAGEASINGALIGIGQGGIGNTRLGDGAFDASSPGNANVAVGAVALSVSTGSANTAIGKGALRFSTTGMRNTVIGTDANQNNTTGSENTVVGRSAFLFNVTGSQNTIVGTEAGRGGPVGRSGNVYLGYQAGFGASGNNLLYIENSSSSNPLIYGEFDNDIVAVNGSLGVGTEAPSDELHVEGSVRMVDGNEADGFIPVSDSNGTMVWTDPAAIQTDTLHLIQDADEDTKIQVEENTDEDVIRFDLGGTEYFKMDPNVLTVNMDTDESTLSFPGPSGTNTIVNTIPMIIAPPATPDEHIMDFNVKSNQTLRLRGDGAVRINDEYTLPVVDGTANQALLTDGGGNVDWGNVVTTTGQLNMFKTTVSKNLPNVSSGNSELVTFNVPGAAVGATVTVSPEDELTNGLVICYTRVRNANTVEIKFRNVRNSGINEPNMDWYFTIVQ